MAYQYFLLLTATVICIALCKKCSRSLKLFSLLPMYIAFVTLYLFTGDQLAQDRDEYYRWYLNSEELFKDTSSRDWLFSGFLSIFPSGLTASQFAVVLSSIIFFLLACLLVTAARRFPDIWHHIPLVLVVSICDRLFLDMVFNASRSSIAALIFLISIVTHHKWIRFALWGLTLGIHMRLGVGLICIYFLFVMPNWPISKQRFVVSVAIIAFALRIAIGSPLIPQLSFLDLLITNTESESILRGLSTTAELTFSLATQIIISLLIPSFIIIFLKNKKLDFHDKSSNYLVSNKLLSFAIGTTSVSIALYPDLFFAQRLFVIPILGLPLFLSHRPLAFIAIIKFFIIAIVLKDHLA